MPSPAGLVVLPRLRVQNANAISSPLTWGPPAPAAFLGFAHALERRLRETPAHADLARGILGVGIVCHRFDPQVFQPNRRRHYIFTQTRNPVAMKRDIGKFINDGTPAAIVEEGRAHLEITLVLAVQDGFADRQEADDLAEALLHLALGMRLAGGSVFQTEPARKAEWMDWPLVRDDRDKAFRRLRRRLLPGFALVHRPDLLAQHRQTLGADTPLLDVLLDLTQPYHRPLTRLDSAPPEDFKLKELPESDWETRKAAPGWLVALPIGYAGLGALQPPGSVANTRDSTTPFRFVESLISLGEWRGPHRLDCLEQLLWRYESEPDAGLYRSVNDFALYQPPPAAPEETPPATSAP
jgi:CRISPR-associated protein Csy2